MNIKLVNGLIMLMELDCAHGCCRSCRWCRIYIVRLIQGTRKGDLQATVLFEGAAVPLLNMVELLLHMGAPGYTVTWPSASTAYRCTNESVE